MGHVGMKRKRLEPIDSTVATGAALLDTPRRKYLHGLYSGYAGNFADSLGQLQGVFMPWASADPHESQSKEL